LRNQVIDIQNTFQKPGSNLLGAEFQRQRYIPLKSFWKYDLSIGVEKTLGIPRQSQFSQQILLRFSE